MPSLFRHADRLLRHPDELLKVLGSAMSKAYAKRSLLWKVFEDFLLLFRLIKAWVSGEYREVPRRVMLWAILAILYFLSPLDFIPDIFPGGYLDDITVITFVLRKFRTDFDKFSEWERKKKKG